MSKVLIVIDMQNDFVTGALGSTMAQEIVPKVVERVNKAVTDGDYLIFTKDTHFDDYMETLEGEKLPIPHCIKDSEGWEIIPQLKENVTNVIEKYTFGSIFSLPGAVASVEEIELIGVCTDICVVSNALVLRAYYPNKKITINSKCCAGTSIEAHESALSVMKSCQIDII